MENSSGAGQIPNALQNHSRQLREYEAANPGSPMDRVHPECAVTSSAIAPEYLFNHLHGLGFSYPKDSLQTHIGRSRRIRVMWKSWCDSLYASNDGVRVCVVIYMGSGLTTAQKTHVIRNSELGHAVDGKDGWGVMWFGSVMHEGLRGYMLSKADADGGVSEQKVMIFATDMEIEEGVPEMQSYDLGGDVKITDIKVLSDGRLMLSTKTQATNTNSILNVLNFKQLRQHLTSGSLPQSFTEMPYVPRNPPVCVTNATTTTALDTDGKVWTSTTDPRYPKTLGRPYEGNPDFTMVPYLSETTITKIVSGGYMTAAVNSDGELFLWGQASPGSTGELRVLNGSVEGAMSRTGASAMGEQDEYVKCLDIFIDGEEARVHDVAIGHGYIMVATEVRKDGMTPTRAVFAAGDNSKNQIGLGAAGAFCEDFEEVVAWRDKPVVQLVGAGWSGLAVLAEH